MLTRLHQCFCFQIHDSSFGGSSSEDEDFPGGLYGHQSAAANALLYVGLGTVAIGLVIAFVGTGEKGFKTLELRLIGPTLIGSGVSISFVVFTMRSKWGGGS